MLLKTYQTITDLPDFETIYPYIVLDVLKRSAMTIHDSSKGCQLITQLTDLNIVCKQSQDKEVAYFLTAHTFRTL